MVAARFLSVFSLVIASIPIAYIDNLAVSIAEEVRFISPGQDSELTSPIHLEAELPIHSGVIRVELHARYGQLLARRLLAPVEGGHLELDIPFEIPTDSEAAILLISIEDAYDQTQEVTSLDVTLLAEGRSTLGSGDPSQIMIETPVDGDTISGGWLTVSGRVSGLDAGPILVQLITRSGRVLDSQDVYATMDDAGNGVFAVELVYSTRNADWARLSVARQRAGTIVLLRSLEILLIN